MKKLAQVGIGAAAVLAVIGAAVAPAHARGSHARITPSAAQTVALHRFHGKIVGKTKLENEEGKWQYSVMVRSGVTLREVMVGAYSGKIENVEVTTASKERREDFADKAATRRH